jgi:hypothetical protein
MSFVPTRSARRPAGQLSIAKPGVSGVARGARLPKSRFGSTLEMLATSGSGISSAKRATRAHQPMRADGVLHGRRCDYSSSIARARQRDLRGGPGEKEAAGSVSTHPAGGAGNSSPGPSQLYLHIFAVDSAARWMDWSILPLHEVRELFEVEPAFRSRLEPSLTRQPPRQWMRPISKEGL